MICSYPTPNEFTLLLIVQQELQSTMSYLDLPPSSAWKSAKERNNHSITTQPQQSKTVGMCVLADYNMQVAKSDSTFMSRLANIRKIAAVL